MTEHQNPGRLTLRLPYRPPIQLAELLVFLGLRAVPGVEEYTDGSYRRSLRLPHGSGVLTVSAPAQSDDDADPDRAVLQCVLDLEDPRDLDAATRCCRSLLDLDARPDVIDGILAADPLLAPLVARAPGRRAPGTADPGELAVRAVLGQQVTLAGARALAGRLVAGYGTPLATPVGSITHTFPAVAALARVDPAELAMPRARQRALVGLATALANGEVSLDGSAEPQDVAERLLGIPGIGPWTVAYIRMRALADPDVFLPTDIGVRNGLKLLGRPVGPAEAGSLAEAWRPWRSYALHHLWAVVAADHLDRAGARQRAAARVG